MASKSNETSVDRDVYLVDGARTPFLKARGKPGHFSATDLALAASEPLFLRHDIEATDLDEVVYGCVMPNASETNIARIIALRIGGGDKLTAHTVQRNCASGLQAIDTAVRNIAHGYSDLVLAGGVDAMSHAPLLLKPEMVNWLAGWGKAKSLPQKLKALSKLKGGYLAPVIGLLKGLTDPVVGLSMGQTAENLAHRFHISRNDMDSFAVESHLRLTDAINSDIFKDEVVNLYDAKGNAYESDDGVRPDSNVEKLATLKPFFDKPYGNVTPANSSQITDGACSVLLASAEAVRKHNLPVLAKLSAAQWAGLDPAQMGLGPAHSIAKTLTQHNMKLEDISQWEINEAFAAQVQACVLALDDEDYCKNELGLSEKIGEIPRDILNVDGGAISCGHPVGASGARIVLHLAHTLKNKNSKHGIASLCIGGGQGGAMLVENVS